MRPYAPDLAERQGAGQGPAVDDLGLFGAEHPQQDEDLPEYEPDLAAYQERPRRGAHRARRRRGPVIAGLAFAATTLTAVAVTLILRPSGPADHTDRTASDTHPSPMEVDPTAGGDTPGPHSASPSPTATPAKPSTSSPASPKTTSPSATRSTTRPPSSTPPAHGGSRSGGDSHRGDGRVPGHDHRHRHSSGALKPGDSGPEVTDLQRRLAAVGLYSGSTHGRYDGGVQSAVARFQHTYGVHGDEAGRYGPHTRRTLEARTGR
ncbi:MAG: peptidoglycan-binding protein [Kitasatospora sp.]|nr:peptidoglycan-binding protein [Kitasatospora sp.]